MEKIQKIPWECIIRIECNQSCALVPIHLFQLTLCKIHSHFFLDLENANVDIVQLRRFERYFAYAVQTSKIFGIAIVSVLPRV